MPDHYKCIGKSPVRSGAAHIVQGRSAYIDDIEMTGMLHGKVLHSPYAHARILGVDVSKAKKLPGVKGVVTGADVPFLHGEALLDKPFLAIGKVRYEGEGVAAVAAIDDATAENALNMIAVEYEPLPAVFDPLESIAPGAPLIHENFEEYIRAPNIRPINTTNVCHQFKLEKGDVEKGFKASDYIFEDTFATPAMQHCSLEPHGAICLINDDDHITLWTNNDSPYRCRKEIATALRIPLTHVRVISAPNIGGNFGGKGGLQAEAYAIALAWKVRNKPIKVVYSREEEFYASLVRHPSVIRIKTGVLKDGTMLARKVKMYWATGAYAEKGPSVIAGGGVTAAGPYRIPNICIDGYCIYTNRQISGAMRGYGAPQACWAYESQMDIIAAELGLDPIQIRLKHVYQDGDIHANGQVLYSEGLKACLEKLSENMQWNRRPPDKCRGRGIACMEKVAGKHRSGSAAFIKVNEDGTVDLLSSTTEVGQGSATVLCQIAAEELGVPLAWVRKATPDTAFTPFDTSTTSSRSTFFMGNAVKMAAADAREQILKLAAAVLEANAADLSISNGNIHVEGVPQKSLSIAQVLKAHFGSSATVLGKGYFFPDHSQEKSGQPPAKVNFWLLGAHGVEVEVDKTTGAFSIEKIYAAHDTGKAIHPSNCEGQAQGGISWGLSQALFEEITFKDGCMLNPSLVGYKISSARDVPEMECIIVECSHEKGPFGAKGVAEASNAPTPPAIANAIYDAVGVRIKDLPITPEKILEALKRKPEK